MRRSPVLALVFGLGLVLGTASTVIAKAGIIARLDAPLPRDPPAGAVLTIGWTIITQDGSGLTGTAIILRVYPSTGGAKVDVAAQEDRAGHYIASVTVPIGGIATVGIGIPGESCAGDVCTPAVEFFTVTDPTGAPIASPPGVQPPSTSTSRTSQRTADDPSSAGLLVFLVGSVLLAMAIWPRRQTQPANGGTGERI